MAETPPINDGSDYGSDVLTDFESEMFRSITSLSTEKSIPVARKTQNVTTYWGKIEPVLSCASRQKKSGNRSTLRPADDHTSLENIPVFFQPAPPPSQFQRQKEINHSLSRSEAEEFNDPDAAADENDKNDDFSQKDVDRNDGDNASEPPST